MNTTGTFWSGEVAEFCQRFVQAGLLWWVQSALILGMGLLVGRIFRRRGPAFQTHLYRMTLIAPVVAFLSSLCLAGKLAPVWQLSLPVATSSVPEAAAASSTSFPMKVNSPPMAARAAAEASSAAVAADRFSPSLPPEADVPAAQANAAESPTIARPSVPPAAVQVTESAEEPVSLWQTGYFLLMVCWLAGTLLLLGWNALGLWNVRRLIRASAPVNDLDLQVTLNLLCMTARQKTPPLRMGSRVSGPLLAGVLRPVLLLPVGFVSEYGPDARGAVLAHEVAHLKNRDCAWNLLARLLCALAWTQPLLWILLRRMEQCSEEECDLAVLEQGHSAPEYASCLLNLAARLNGAPSPMAGMAAVRPRSCLGRRIEQILSYRSHRPRRLTPGAQAAILCGTVLAACGGVSLISTAQSAPEVSVAKTSGESVSVPKEPARALDSAQAVDTATTSAVSAAAPSALPSEPSANPDEEETQLRTEPENRQETTSLPAAPDASGADRRKAEAANKALTIKFTRLHELNERQQELQALAAIIAENLATTRKQFGDTSPETRRLEQTHRNILQQKMDVTIAKESLQKSLRGKSLIKLPPAPPGPPPRFVLEAFQVDFDAIGSDSKTASDSITIRYRIENDPNFPVQNELLLSITYFNARGKPFTTASVLLMHSRATGAPVSFGKTVDPHLLALQKAPAGAVSARYQYQYRAQAASGGPSNFGVDRMSDSRSLRLDKTSEQQGKASARPVLEPNREWEAQERERKALAEREVRTRLLQGKNPGRPSPLAQADSTTRSAKERRELYRAIVQNLLLRQTQVEENLATLKLKYASEHPLLVQARRQADILQRLVGEYTRKMETPQGTVPRQ